MASIPGTRFDITGASGSQGLLTPKSGWRVYVLPRGGYASQDSTGTLITFDSAAVASRFAANNWIQAGLATANIRLVAAVGGNSLSVSGAALTITENDRIYIIGNTEPTVSGGSATYLTPNTLVRQRDDDGADLYTNSMITSNADGLVQFFAAPNFYDAIVQDGNRTNQGSIIDLPVGSVGGISTDTDALFGASVTVNGAFGVTGWATFGSTATFNAAIGVTGWATFGSTVTMHAALGVTGTITGTTATFTRLVTGTSASFSNDVNVRRLIARNGTTLTVAALSISATWGSTATTSFNGGVNNYDTRGSFIVTCGGAGIAANPTVTLTYVDGALGQAVYPVVSRSDDNAPTTGFWIAGTATSSTIRFTFIGTPVAGSNYGFNWIMVV